MQQDLKHPLCDKAIAFMMYWLLDKYSNFSLHAEEWPIIKPILEKIVYKLQNNEYKEVLTYGPNKEVKPVKWKIPDCMFKKLVDNGIILYLSEHKGIFQE